MALLDNFAEVTDDNPCPICGRPDWCMMRNDGRQVICPRTENDRPCGEAGWMHDVIGEPAPAPAPREKADKLTPKEVKEYLAWLDSKPFADMLDAHAKLLHLPVSALQRMQVRVDLHVAALATPMFGAGPIPIGFHYRRRDDRKFCKRGSRLGLFVSSAFDPKQPVFVCEGMSDSAALCAIGLANVLGRPSCSGGSQHICQRLESHRTTPVIIISDPDEPGRHGAQRLAQVLPNPTAVLVAETDVRDLVVTNKLSDATRHDILAVAYGYRRPAWEILGCPKPHMQSYFRSQLQRWFFDGQKPVPKRDNRRRKRHNDIQPPARRRRHKQ